jgi:peptidoglycan biosynthesis protein MviN/MurJ (putative lipid II flippase)
MSLGLMALLAGLFVVPVALLWMGHRLRRRSAAWRGAFWGAVTGHALGMLVTVAALHYPPVLWGDGGSRPVLVYWPMLLGAVAGGAIGWMLGARRGGAPGQRDGTGAPPPDTG